MKRFLWEPARSSAFNLNSLFTLGAQTASLTECSLDCGKSEGPGFSEKHSGFFISHSESTHIHTNVNTASKFNTHTSWSYSSLIWFRICSVEVMQICFLGHVNYFKSSCESLNLWNIVLLLNHCRPAWALSWDWGDNMILTHSVWKEWRKASKSSAICQVVKEH